MHKTCGKKVNQNLFSQVVGFLMVIDLGKQIQFQKKKDLLGGCFPTIEKICERQIGNHLPQFSG